MTEQLKDLPDGFKWQELPGIKARAPMPEDWHYLAEAVPGTQAFYMSRERVTSGHYSKFFQVGMSLQAFSRMIRSRVLPSSFAQRTIEMPKAEMEPTSDVEVITKGPHVTYRQQYAFAGGQLEGRTAGPLRFYWAATGNDLRDVAYVSNFEAPAEEWEKYQEVAKLMVEETVLNPRVR